MKNYVPKLIRRGILFIKHYWLLLLVVVAFTIIVSTQDEIYGGSRSAIVEQMTISRDKFKLIFGEKFTRRKPKILLWTRMFGSMSWYEGGKWDFANLCKSDCVITDDKRDLQTADAIVFHLYDITWLGNAKNGFRFQFPSYRRPDQVWVLYNLEPLTVIQGDLGGWQGVFNWTWSYSNDSDVRNPYGQYRRLNNDEISKTASERKNTPMQDHDNFSNKTNSGGLAIVSNCVDDARRFRLIEKLRQFINVDVYGKCGKPCPGKKFSCESVMSSYQFYLAFENSNCREYVTEKYWSTLNRNMIPVVAWKYPMDGFVIPNSYINLYDFKDLDTAADYIKRVSENRTLYNSYFDWKMTYKTIVKTGFCSLCEALKDTEKPAQVYDDLLGWFGSFSCQPTTVSILTWRIQQTTT